MDNTKPEAVIKEKVDIKSQSRIELDYEDKIAKEHYKIFEKALSNAISVLPVNQKEYKVLLERLKVGFERQRDMNDSLISKMHRMYEHIVQNATQELADMEEEYNEFK